MAWSPKIGWKLLGWQTQGDLGPVTTYTSRRGKLIVYDKAPPLSPPTQAQITQRQRWTAAAKAWSRLSAQEQANWEAASKSAGASITGFNVWIYTVTTQDPAPARTIARQSRIPLQIPIVPPTTFTCPMNRGQDLQGKFSMTRPGWPTSDLPPMVQDLRVDDIDFTEWFWAPVDGDYSWGVEFRFFWEECRYELNVLTTNVPNLWFTRHDTAASYIGPPQILMGTCVVTGSVAGGVPGCNLCWFFSEGL